MATEARGSKLDVLAHTNRLQLSADFSDEADDLICVYPVLRSQIKYWSFVVFNALTLMIFYPVFVFVPTLRLSLVFEASPNPKRASHFVLRREGGGLKVVKRVSNGRADEPPMFEYMERLYVFLAKTKRFAKSKRSLSDYSDEELRALLEGRQPDQDGLLSQEIEWRRRKASQKVSMTFEIFGLVEAVAIVGLLAWAIKAGLGMVLLHLGSLALALWMNWQRALKMGEGYQMNGLKPGDIIKAQETRCEAVVNSENGELVRVCAGESFALPTTILITKIMDRQTSYSSEWLRRLTNHAIVHVFVPVFSIALIYFFVLHRNLLFNICAQALLSISPFLVLGPHLYHITQVIRLHAGLTPRHYDSDSCADIHSLDKLLEKVPETKYTHTLAYSSSQAPVESQDLPHPLDALLPKILPAILAGQVKEQRKAFSAELNDGAMVHGQIIGLEGLDEETIKRDLEEGKYRYRIRQIKEGSAGKLAVSGPLDQSPAVDIIITEEKIHVHDDMHKVIERHQVPSHIMSSLLKNQSCFYMDCYESSKRATFTLVVAERAIEGSGNKSDRRTGNRKQAGQVEILSERSQRRKTAGRMLGGEVRISCKKFEVDLTEQDTTLLVDMIEHQIDAMAEKRGELLISGSVLRVIKTKLTQVNIGYLMKMHSTERNLCWVGLSDETGEVCRTELEGGSKTGVGQSLSSLAESRTAYSASIGMLKLNCGLTLGIFIACMLLLPAESPLSHSQILSIQLLVGLPFLLAGPFASRQLFIIDQGTSRFFSSERVSISIIGNFIIQLVFQNLMRKALRNQFFYIDPLIYNTDGERTYDNASNYKLSLYLALGTAGCAGIEDAFKSTVWRNPLFRWLALSSLGCILAITWVETIDRKVMQLCSLPLFFNTVIGVMGFLGMLALMNYEDKIVARSVLWRLFSKVFN
jgi:hypothetical protein